MPQICHVFNKELLAVYQKRRKFLKIKQSETKAGIRIH